MDENKISFDVLLKFVRANGLALAMRGGLSLAVVVLAIAVYFAFAPRSECYKNEIQITLESRDGELVYPNGDRFGVRDIISAPVLNVVWKKYGIDAKGVKFDEFCQWFSVISYDKERAKVDAEFQSKMSKRNITVTELTTLQKEYEAKLASLSANRFAVAMKPQCALDRDTAVRMLGEIPEIWFGQYAVIKAPQIPAVVAADAVAAYVARSKSVGGRALEMIDAVRQYLSELDATCEFVRTGIMRGRNATIDGCDLGTFEAQLKLMSAELLRLKNRLLINGSEEDLGGYVAARLDDMECEKMSLDESVKAVQQILDQVGDGNRKAVDRGKAFASSADSTPVTVQADSGFFSDFVTMIRRDANHDLVLKYAQELTELRKQLAELASRQLYYDQINRYIKANSSSKARSAKALEESTADVERFMAELFAVGRKIVEFRDRSLAIYRTSDQFYVVAEPTAYSKSFVVSIPRFALGLLAIWAFYNLMSVVSAWNKRT